MELEEIKQLRVPFIFSIVVRKTIFAVPLLLPLQSLVNFLVIIVATDHDYVETTAFLKLFVDRGI